MLWERYVDTEDVVYTLLLAILIFQAYFAVTPQRAEIFLEHCTNSVAKPFGVRGALEEMTLKHVA